MTRLISLTGIDGTGKTTAIRHLKALTAEDPSFLQAFRAPQFHEDPETPLGRISAAIDALSVLADQKRDPVLKGVALFLSMTLYGDVENYYTTTYRPKILIGERQPLADCLAYSVFYVQLIGGPFEKEALEPLIQSTIGPEAFQALKNWVKLLAKRDRIFEREEGFWGLSSALKQLFELPKLELLSKLKDIFHLRNPDQIIILQVSQEKLSERLIQKAGSGTERELHERQTVLEQLQRALTQSCDLLKHYQPDLKIHCIDTSNLDILKTCSRVLSLVAGNSDLKWSDLLSKSLFGK